jgi:23S rRNA pseudouridine2605 synthase
VYRVKVKGRVRDDVLARWAEGIEIDGRPTRPADVVRLRESADNVWIGLTLYEGRYHQVHRMCEATGLRLMRLARISFAGITVEGLRPGEYRQLDRREVAQLRKLVAQPEPRTRLAPPPPGLDDLPESHRGEEDDGAWAAWNEGTLWELLGEPSGAAPGSAVASGVVRRRPDAGDGQRADRWFPMSEDRPAPLRGRLEGEFEDDEWESGEGPEPESRGAGGKVPPPAESRPRREVEGRRGRAFAPGPARGSRPGKPRG